MEDNSRRTIYAELRFTSVMLDPLTVTQVLQLPPDEQYRVGEPHLVRRRKDGKIIDHSPRRVSFWSMSSAWWVESERLSDHLDWVLTELESHSHNLELFLEAGVRVEIRGFAETKSADNEVPEELQRRAQKLAVPIICSYDE